MLDLTNIISIEVNSPAVTQSGRSFSLGLIVSQNTVISTDDRLKEYTSTAAMIKDGFTTDSPEVLAAGLFFGQTPAPAAVLVGTQDSSETAVEALTACRAANGEWYIGIILGAAKADITALAAYVEGASPACVLFYTTADSDVLAGADGNVCKTLQEAAYRRSLGQYSTQANAVCGIAGYASGANDGVTSYDLMFKPEVGVTPEDISADQALNLDGENCNYLVTRSSDYTFFQAGVMADGTFFDEVLGIDVLTENIQDAVINVQMSSAKVPQTDAGISVITAAIGDACKTSVDSGFLAPGVWTGAPVASLSTGDHLPSGYTIMVGSVDDQSATDRAKRVTPPIYVCVKLAGSVHSVVIVVNVNR